MSAVYLPIKVPSLHFCVSAACSLPLLAHQFFECRHALDECEQSRFERHHTLVECGAVCGEFSQSLELGHAGVKMQARRLGLFGSHPNKNASERSCCIPTTRRGSLNNGPNIDPPQEHFHTFENRMNHFLSPANEALAQASGH